MLSAIATLCRKLRINAKDESGQTVLIIAAVLTGVALTGAALFLNLDAGKRIIDRLKSSNASQGSAMQAVMAYYFADTTGAGTAPLRVPCPSEIDSGAPTGVAAATCDGSSDPNAGVLPWISLGLSRDQALDAQGNYLTYVVSPDAADICDTMATDYGGGEEITGTLKASSLTVSDGTTSRQTPFVIIDHGANKLGARSSNNTATGAPASDNETSNCDPLVCAANTPSMTSVVSGPFTGSQGEDAFDDKVFVPSVTTLEKMCQSRTPGGALNATLTDSFAPVDPANNLNSTGLDNRKYDEETQGVAVVADTNNPGNQVARFVNPVTAGEPGAALFTNTANYDFDPRPRPVYVSTIWTPDVGEDGGGGLSVVTRVTALDQSLYSDRFAANGKHGVTIRYYDADLAADNDNIDPAPGIANTLSIRDDGACVAISGTGTCASPSGGTYSLITGKTYLVEAYDDGTYVWGRITQTDDATNTATVGPFPISADLDGNNQVAIVGGPNTQYIDNLTIGYGGLSLSMNGAEYMRTANLGLGTAGDSATFEAWVRPRTITGSDATIMGTWDVDAAPGINSFRVYLDDEGSLKVGLSGQRTVLPAAPAPFNEEHTFGKLTTGVWTHVAVVYDAPTKLVSLYLNGVLSSTATSGIDTTGIVNGTGNFVVGADNSTVATFTPSHFFDGDISDVRVWSSARSAADIDDNYRTRLAYTGSVTDLVLNWKADADPFNGIDIRSVTAVSTGTAAHAGTSSVTAATRTVNVTGNINLANSGMTDPARVTATVAAPTVTAGNRMRVVFTNTAVFGAGGYEVEYTVTSVDALASLSDVAKQISVADGLTAAIRHDTFLSALGVSASNNGAVITVSHNGTAGNSTTLSDNSTIPGDITFSNGGVLSGGDGDTIALTFDDGVFTTTPHTVAYTIRDADAAFSTQAERRIAVATGLAAAINADTRLQNTRVSATSTGASNVVTISELGSTGNSTTVTSATTNYTNVGTVTVTGITAATGGAGTVGDAQYAASLSNFFRPFAGEVAGVDGVCEGFVVSAYQCDFRRTLGTSLITIPSNLNGVYVKAWGGGGGGFNASISATPYTSAGGGGGFSGGNLASISSTNIAGAVLQVIVGGGGTGSETYTSDASIGGYGNGGGGGGASGVRLSGSTAGIVAGGGGGASFSNNTLLGDTGTYTFGCATASIDVTIVDDPMAQCGIGGPGGGAGASTSQAPDVGDGSCGGRGGSSSPTGADPPHTSYCPAPASGGDPSATVGGGSGACGAAPLAACGGSSDLGAGGNGYAASTTEGGVGGGGGGGGANDGALTTGGGEAGGYGLVAYGTMRVNGSNAPANATLLEATFVNPTTGLNVTASYNNPAGATRAAGATGLAAAISAFSGLSATATGRDIAVFHADRAANDTAFTTSPADNVEQFAYVTTVCTGNTGNFSNTTPARCNVQFLLDSDYGMPQEGDLISIRFRNTGHSSDITVTYTVQSSDTTIPLLVASLAANINASSVHQATCSSPPGFCITATANGDVLELEDAGNTTNNTTINNGITFDTGTDQTLDMTTAGDLIPIGAFSGGASTAQGSSNGFGGGGGAGYADSSATRTQGQSGLAVATATVDSIVAGNTVALTFTNPSISGLPLTMSVIVAASNDTQTKVAKRLASLITRELSGYRIFATSSGAVISVFQQGWYTQQSPLGTGTTLSSTGTVPGAVTLNPTSGILASGTGGGYSDYNYGGPGFDSDDFNVTPGRGGTSSAIDGSDGAVTLSW